MATANGAAPVQTDGPLGGDAGPSLAALADSLSGNSHLLSVGDERISRLALEAAKSIFDYGISLEPLSHPHLHPFIASIIVEPPITLRSSTVAKSAKSKGKQPTPPPPPPAPEDVLPYTPLSELTTEGLDVEQVWAQLELRAEGVVKVIGEVGEGGMDSDDEANMQVDSDSDEEDSEEEGSDEEMSVEEWERMMAERSDSDSDEGSDDEDEHSDGDSEEGDSDEDEDEEEGDSDDSDNRVVFKNGAVATSDESDDAEEDDDEEEEEEGEDEEADEDEDVEMGSDDDDGLDIDIDGSDLDPDLAGGSDLDEDGDDDESSPLAGPSKLKPNGKGKGKRSHPTLDDEFFSIDEFNRLTEEAEAGHLGSGRLGGDDDDDDEEELGDIGDLMLKGADEDEPLMYGDFFAPPRQTPEERAKAMRELEKSGKSPKANGSKAGKKPSKEEKKSKKSKGKGKGKAAESDDEEEVEEDEEVQDGGRDIMSRVKGDLFDSDDEQEEQVLSTHEKRQLALKEQIAELEGQAIGPKDWVLMGEASSRARPENSLLEQDLDFEHAGKVVPTVTEESVASLEELIKRRILDNEFNSTVRVRAYEPTPFLPSRFFELQDTQSAKSLAQIYEDDYQSAASGSAKPDARDEKLRKEHEAIDELWTDICYKLDALSSLNFVPKAPKAQITTVDNLPTTSMESALPTTASTSTMLAPEEQFAPPTASSLVARTEMTPEEKQKLRGKNRKAKAAMRKGLEEMAELHGRKKKQSVKEQKDEAMKSLVKQGKGVTVIGKGSKEAAKAQGRKRSNGEEGERENAKRLKL